MTRQTFVISILKEYCVAHNISIVIPTIDTELNILSYVKDEFFNDGIFLGGCGDSNTPLLSDDAIFSSISGVVKDGPIKNTRVNLDGSCSAGEPIAMTN